MILGQFVLSTIESNAFILGCRETREALLIDAGVCDPRFQQFLELHELRLTQIFVTHQHWDHVDGLPELLGHYEVPILSYLGELKGCATTRVAPGDVIRVGRHAGRLVHTPGHTPDGLSLIFPTMAFTGDALFAGSVGGTSTEEEAERQLSAIRDHIFTLPDETELHVGHGPSSTVGIERRFNPFFV